MEEFVSMEPGYSDSLSLPSEPPDITNWFSSYVYESFPLSSLVKGSESEVDGFSSGEPDRESKYPFKFVSNKDHNQMSRRRLEQISDREKLFESSLPSEPPDIGNWFPGYVYESPVLDTSDGLDFSVPGESERFKKREIKEETEKEKTKLDRSNVSPTVYEQGLNSSTKVTDFSPSQVLSEPPDVRIWFSEYQYETPQLSDAHELGFSPPEKDPLIIDESDTEEENSSGIFRKTRGKQETVASSRLQSNDLKDNIAPDTAKEASSDTAYSDQDMKYMAKISSDRFWNALTKEVKQDSSFKQEPFLNEPKQDSSVSRGVSSYTPNQQSLSSHKASFQELKPTHIQETISMNSSRQKSPRKAIHRACLARNLESDDKENVHGKRNETGFVTTKRERSIEARERCSRTKPDRAVLVECSRSKEYTNTAGEEGEERRKKRRVLTEMSDLQFSKAEEIAGKWRCPQKNKGNLVPPLKQLRLDAWVHKV